MNIKYSEQYDAYYNADTGEWAEVGCGDPTCEFCAGRPEKAPIVDTVSTNQTKEN